MEFSAHNFEKQPGAAVPPSASADVFEARGAQGEITAPGGYSEEPEDPSAPAAVPTEYTEPAAADASTETADTQRRPSKWMKYELTDQRSGRIVRGWVPKAPATQNPAEGTNSVEARLSGTTRHIDARILKRALEFNNTFTERAELGHDCLVFAYACSSGDSVADIVATEGTGNHFATNEAMVARQSPEEIIAQGVADRLKPGTVIAVSTASREAFFDGDVHYMVKATTDEGVALFLSKFGPEAYVALTDLAEVVTAYGAQSIAQIGEIRAVHPERRPTDEQHES